MVERYGAKRPRLHLWGVAERSESFKIMIAGGNHTTVESCQPERADLSARRRYASEQPPQAALSESQRGCRAYFRVPIRIKYKNKRSCGLQLLFA